MTTPLLKTPLNIHLIIFDWDGTLIDSTAHIVRTLRTLFVENNLPCPTSEKAKSVIGLSFNKAIDLLVADPLKKIDQQHLIRAYPQHYEKNSEHIALFEGVLQGLKILKKRGLQLAIATGKNRAGLNLALEATGLKNIFATTRTVSECFSKPDPQMIHSILEELAVSPKHALMVGDTSFDLEMAKNANIKSIGVSYGAHPKKVLEGACPLIVVDSFVALCDWFMQNLLPSDRQVLH